MSFDFVAGDTGSWLKVQCVDAYNVPMAVPLGSTVTLRWKTSGLGVTPVVYKEKTMNIDDPETGKVSYRFLGTELVAGKMRFEVVVTDVLTNKVTSVNVIEVSVRGPL